MSNVKRLERVRGTTSKEVCLRLIELARRVPGDQAIVEIGAFEARATCFLAHGARRGNGAHVYGIDVWDQVDEGVILPYRMHTGQHRAVRTRMMQSYTRAQRNVVAQGMSRHLTLIQGRSSEVANHWTEEIGLLIIDGESTIESVTTDAAAWFPYLADDATVVFENYDPSTRAGENVVTAVNRLVDSGTLVLEESDDLRIAVGHPATILTLPEPGQAGPLRLTDETEPEPIAAASISVQPLDESGDPSGDRTTVEGHVTVDDPDAINAKKSELDAFAAEMGIDAEPGEALPPVPDDAYPPDATPLPEPEYEDDSDDDATSEAQHGTEHPEPSPATNDAPADEGRSAEDSELQGPSPATMNVKQLREHAEKIGADVKGIYKRDEVLARIHERQRQLNAVDELGQLGQELGT